MRTNQFGELEVMSLVVFEPNDVKNPRGDWKITVESKAVHEKSGVPYDDKQESMMMSELLAEGTLTPEEVATIYGAFAKVFDSRAGK